MEVKVDISNLHRIKMSSFHNHSQWEIIFYIEGRGVFCTREKEYPFEPGTVVFVPPGTYHRSVSEDGFNNIYVRGEFEHLIFLEELLVMRDNACGDGWKLIDLLYRNRFADVNYRAALCSAYIHFLLQEADFNRRIGKAVRRVCAQIAENAFDNRIDVSSYLRDSGYAEDYIRMQFKEIVGMPPLKFLTKIRIEHACMLLKMYKDQLSLTQVAEKCGYTDYIYFTRKFKEQMGMSPQKYIGCCLK